MLTLLPALASWAQQPGGYEISGSDLRLMGQTIYLLTAERPTHLISWPVLDSIRADATGYCVLWG